MSGRDHITDINGNCMPDCRECYIEKLEDRLKILEEIRKDLEFQVGSLEQELEAMNDY